MFRLVVVPLAALIALSALACNGDGDGGEPTSVPTSRPGTTPAAGATPAGDIRERDLEHDPAVRALIDETGGTFLQENVLYADVSDDGIDDAVVPLESGGTLGYLAFLVLTPIEGGTAVLLKEQPPASRSIALDVVDGALIMIEPVFGPDDPECCPSMLRKTTYRWNGQALAIDDVETLENPGGEVKPQSGS